MLSWVSCRIYHNIATQLAVMIVATFAILLANLGVADASISAVDYDKNKNGVLDPKERDVYLVHVASEIHRTLDVNKNGLLDPNEIEAYQKKIIAKAGRKYFDATILNPRVSSSGAIPNVEFDTVFREPEPQSIARKVVKNEDSTTVYGGLLLRREHEDVTVLNDPTVFKRAKSAFAAYSHDFEADNGKIELKGALIYPVRKVVTGAAPSPDNFVLTGASFTPSVSFDIVENTDSRRTDGGSLTLRLGGELEFAGGALFDAQYWRLNGLYARDKDFQAELIGGEAQFEPVISALGIGTSREVFDGKIGYVLRAIAHLEGGRVLDDGGNVNLQKDGDFVRVGPKLQLDFWMPGILDPLTAHIAYSHLDEVTGESESSELFEASIDYLLDPAGHTKFAFEYRHGEIPLGA